MVIPISYVYIIGWTKLDRYYLGVRYKKGCHPSDLWVKYFTSSKIVKKFQNINGDPDIKMIVREFDLVDNAREYETILLQCLDVKNNEKWLNKHDKASPPILIGKDNGIYGKIVTKETRKNMSNSAKKRGGYSGSKNGMYGKKWSETTREKMKKRSSCSRGRIGAISDDHRLKISKANKGRKFSEESRKKISESITMHWQKRRLQNGIK